MIIEKDLGNDYYGNLIINNYPNLQSIIVKKNSLKNLNSLKICNCEKLKTIEIEDSEERYFGTFSNVKNVIIESIWLFEGCHLYLPNLQSFITGKYSFRETRSLSLSSNSIQFYFSIYLPNLQSFETGYQSFNKITSLSLSSNSI